MSAPKRRPRSLLQRGVGRFPRTSVRSVVNSIGVHPCPSVVHTPHSREFARIPDRQPSEEHADETAAAERKPRMNADTHRYGEPFSYSFFNHTCQGYNAVTGGFRGLPCLPWFIPSGFICPHTGPSRGRGTPVPSTLFAPNARIQAETKQAAIRPERPQYNSPGQRPGNRTASPVSPERA